MHQRYATGFPWLGAVLFLAFASVSTGCAQNRVVNKERLLWVNQTKSASTHVWLWGLLPTEVDVSQVEPNDGSGRYDLDIQEVRFRQSFLESLVAIVTLGIYMPGSVEWDLAAPRLRSARVKVRPHELDITTGDIEVTMTSSHLAAIEVENLAALIDFSQPDAEPSEAPPFIQCQTAPDASGSFEARCRGRVEQDGRLLITVGSAYTQARYSLAIRREEQTLASWTDQPLIPSADAEEE